MSSQPATKPFNQQTPVRDAKRAARAETSARIGSDARAPRRNVADVRKAAAFHLDDLHKRHPEMSAATLNAAPVMRTAGLIAAMLLLSAALGPALMLPWIAALLALPFLCIAAVRIAAIADLTRLMPAPKRVAVMRPDADAPLPHYAVLVPLYDEAAVLPQLIGGLEAIDYPADKLDICLIVEEGDPRTRNALAAMELPAHMRVTVVPPGLPRTKPRALNHALRSTDSEFVVVYDAEDLPDPDQLHRALGVFAEGGASTACVQARLGLYNPQATWLSRQFTLEYAALFVGILPALERLGLPLPLGGTSNHFRRRVLEEAGSWDSYNVTEDADLGIRLSRLGFEVRTLSSTTWEEAPETFGVWLAQRTRWLKGWMQTYLVHMRRPKALLRELGPWRFAGFQVLMGGMILSALVHPWVYVGLAWGLVTAGEAEPLGFVGLMSDPLWSLAIANLIAGFASAILLGALTARETCPRLVAHTLLMPFYWLAISLAAYRAAGQLIARPFLWEKTPHRGRARTPASPES